MKKATQITLLALACAAIATTAWFKTSVTQSGLAQADPPPASSGPATEVPTAVPQPSNPLTAPQGSEPSVVLPVNPSPVPQGIPPIQSSDPSAVPPSPSAKAPIAVKAEWLSDERCFGITCAKALDKSVEVLTRNLSIKAVQPAEIPKMIKEIDKLRACAKLAYTATTGIYQGALGKNENLFILVIKGELSGSNVLLGSNCGNLVVLPPVQAMVLSYAAEEASKHDKSIVRRSLVPTEFANAKSESSFGKTATLLHYKTDVGFIDITVNERSSKVNIATSDGKTIYLEEFELN
jgi:hypothetical protein